MDVCNCNGERVVVVDYLAVTEVVCAISWQCPSTSEGFLFLEKKINSKNDFRSPTTHQRTHPLLKFR